VNSDRVRHVDLVKFASDVATFLKGDGKEIDPKHIEVAIKKGSLELETSPMINTPH
jgi:hypothetical protein